MGKKQEKGRSPAGRTPGEAASRDERQAAAETRLERQETLDRAERMREEARRKAEERAARTRTYVVKSGDSLSKIAKELLGDASRWPEIHEANRDEIEDPNLIYPGQELRIPS
jgi:nucleoid-associated protein YgaU